ncbi:unnamed protein product [Acanthosepion pharaonis]|uniref:Uncharacterized protein n=1 Tax=Acanthosepion pharaonis TaxID=158019 RepID=A0A812DGL4_ACAPH|nr:unnamed protein product [Sepia pharaonis]
MSVQTPVCDPYQFSTSLSITLSFSSLFSIHGILCQLTSLHPVSILHNFLIDCLFTVLQSIRSVHWLQHLSSPFMTLPITLFLITFPSLFPLCLILASSISPFLLTFLLSFHLSQSVFSIFTPISFIYSFSFSAFSFPFSSLLFLPFSPIHPVTIYLFLAIFSHFFFSLSLSLSLSPASGLLFDESCFIPFRIESVNHIFPWSKATGVNTGLSKPLFGVSFSVHCRETCGREDMEIITLPVSAGLDLF